jgi:protein-S-isoprenylcysteine O-methyltransferase Ste14
METARYVIALITIILFPPALIYWALIHPLTGFWRRIGLVLSYAIFLTIFMCFAVGIYHFRAVVLTVDFGINWILIGFAALLFGIEMVVEVLCRKHLSFTTLVGIPELNPEGPRGVLLKEGIYGKIRHPRYTGGTLGLLAMAFFANYLATYLLILIWFPFLFLITVLEEKELIDRFGEEYREYQRNVPRFIPKRVF